MAANSTGKLKYVVEKLQRRLPLGNRINFGKQKPSSYHVDIEDYAADSSKNGNHVPKDVKEGHFAVIAALGDEPRRFVLPISCLTHPRLVRLLDEAEEEYGFDQNQGVLVIPCGLAELERILVEQNNRHGRRPRRYSWS